MKNVIQYFYFRLLPLVLVIIILVPQSGNAFVNQDRPEDETVVDFEGRLEFYLNERTEELLEQLIANETQLLQLLKNIHKEIADRGQDGVATEEIGFDLVYKEADSLITEYSLEMTRLLRLYDDIIEMEKTTLQTDQTEEWENLLDAKQKVAAALEDRSLYKKRVYSYEAITETVEEYASELDSLLSIFANLEKLEFYAADRGDTATIAMAARQKERVINILASWGPIGPLTDSRYYQYLAEAQRIQDLMQKIEAVEDQAGTTLSTAELENRKRALLSRLDESLIDLFVQSGYKLPSRPNVSEIIDAWNRERIADFKARMIQYKIIRQSLIQSASESELERMLTRELDDALLNYSDGKFLLAENQLELIISDYSPYYEIFDAALFYRAECQFARAGYADASDTYKSFLEQFPSSSYRFEALMRLLEISQLFQKGTDFYTYFKEMRSLDSTGRAGNMDKVYYVAGNQMFTDRRFDKAAELLPLVSPESEYYLPSRLLLGVVEVNLNHHSAAISIFEELSELDSYPWTDLNTAYIRNTALLKLGMMYYERGEYPQAIQYFDQVSQGFDEYDKSLMAQAWANLRLGKYETAIENSNELLLSSLASDYTYEALVLSAHCKRVLDQPESALNAYRYVAGARGIMELRKDYDEERRLVLAQVGELDRIEQEVLDRRKDRIYPEIAQLRSDINQFLTLVRRRSNRGSNLIQDYYDERMDLIDHLHQLDDIVEWAEDESRPDLVREAALQRVRLLQILETFRADQRIVNSSYLVDFPLAAKEANIEYRQEIISSLYQDMQMEVRRIENAIEVTHSLEDTIGVRDEFETQMDLEYLESELSDLRTRLNRFRRWVIGNTPSEPASNIDRWSDMSGFGMSDIVHQGRKERIERIDGLNQSIAAVDRILVKRRQELEDRLAAFEDRLLAMQEEFLSKKIQYEKQERQAYFDNFYFDTKEREEEEWEDRLRHLIEP